jgi:hypothetical protein
LFFESKGLWSHDQKRLRKSTTFENGVTAIGLLQAQLPMSIPKFGWMVLKREIDNELSLQQP